MRTRSLFEFFGHTLLAYGVVTLLNFIAPNIFNTSLLIYVVLMMTCALTEATETLKAKRTPGVWWSFPAGSGMGMGIYMFVNIPETSLLHFPVLILTALTVTIFANHFAKYWKSKIIR